ncbi:hypothetical protein KQ51_01045 [Candidatus Izimaplasma bacterium HR1]|jgi:protein-S-isoprenylcysteine O-methyltransferase Ste14|uniref:methyltransferase family protein n=1 Tax=Candidatus Izimoplasma sp. HR1 TaxID=1541959 RepID=UPI0004F5A749|nr:hypothetical protein KQ51_01045 [Candidatus Izimaplasma bacterium HR1]
MLYILIGAFGFIALLVFDLMSLKNQVFFKYFFAFLGLALIIFSTFELVSYNADLFINSYLRIASLLFAVIFMVLLVYSVFIEVGGNSYQKFAEPKLVTNGTYSLVRHPGVIWLFLAYIFLALFSQNSYLLLSAIIWTTVNTIYVIVQEKYILVKIFPNYSEYIKSTPMVIPNYLSVKRFITTKNWRKE